MKEWEKNYKRIFILISIVDIAVGILVMKRGEYVPEKICKSLVAVVLIMLLIAMLMVVVYFVIVSCIGIKMASHNIRECNDPLFKMIDKYRLYWKEEKGYYRKQLQIINLYYKEGGEVDKLVKNEEIERLYERYDFLKVKSTFFEYAVTCAASLIISVIASFVYSQVSAEKNILVILGIIAMAVMLFGDVLFFRYTERGQMGSYKYMLYEYESKLLQQKIEKLSNKLVFSPENEKIIEMQNMVLQELTKIKDGEKNRKQKKVVEKDIGEISKLDLTNYDNYNCREQQVYINGNKAYLVYNKDKEPKDNDMGEGDLINKEYVMLVNILNKYKLLAYHI